MATQEVRIHQYVLYTRVLVFVYTQTLCMYAHTSHCVHTHITPLAEFTFLTEPFPRSGSRYSVNFPDVPMVAYCAKGIAGKKDAGALLLGHLMSHEPYTPSTPARTPVPTSLFFVYTHIAICVYTYVLGVYTRRIRVYTKLHLCIHKI